jgi:molybdopterin molybdotransferase
MPIVARLQAALTRASAAGITFRGPAAPSAIEALERHLGVALPNDIRAFFLLHDGCLEVGVADNEDLLSLNEIAVQGDIWKEQLDGGDFKDNSGGDPGRGVKNNWWNPSWIPVTHNGVGDHVCVDLDPDETQGGCSGQLIRVLHSDSARTLEAIDFVSWLETLEWTPE